MNKLSLSICVLTVIAALFTEIPASAGTGPNLLFQPWGQRQHLEFNGEAMFQHSGKSYGKDAPLGNSLTINQYNFDLRLRPLPNDPHQWVFGASVNQVNITGNSKTLGPRLIDQSYAFGFKAGQITNGWDLRVLAGFGYSGSTPFTDGDAFYAKGSLAAMHKIDDQDTVGLVLTYNGNRQFLPDWPLPSLIWQHIEGRNFALIVGIPFVAIHWKPDGTRWTIDAHYTPTASANFSAEYEFIKHWSFYTSYKHVVHVYHHDGYNPHRRLFFNQQMAEAGIKWVPSPMVRLKVGGGFAFAQSFKRGWDSRDLDTVVMLHDEPYFRVHFTLFF